jgi:acyl carrier protein
MSLVTQSRQSSNSMDDRIALVCVEIFSDIARLNRSRNGTALPPGQILSAPIETFDVDSLTTMEFVMAVEERFEVELDEKAVNRCRTVGEIAALVAAARSG